MVQAVRNAGVDGFVDVFGGELVLPSRTIENSDCSDSASVKFDINIHKQTCSRTVVNLETECSSALGMNDMVQNVYVAKKTNTLSTADDSDDYLKVLLVRTC